MSKTSKLVLGAVIIAIILIAGFSFWQIERKSASLGSASAGTSAEVTTLPSGTSTSDASIEEDLSAIDAQLQGVSNDTQAASASVDASASQ